VLEFHRASGDSRYMNTANKTTTRYSVQVMGYGGKWVDCGPEFHFDTRAQAENRIAVQKRDDFDMNMPRLKQRIVEVVE
jgi:hypothetical protein